MKRLVFLFTICLLAIASHLPATSFEEYTLPASSIDSTGGHSIQSDQGPPVSLLLNNTGTAGEIPTHDVFGFVTQDVNGDGRTDVIEYGPGCFHTYIAAHNNKRKPIVVARSINGQQSEEVIRSYDTYGNVLSERVKPYTSSVPHVFLLPGNAPLNVGNRIIQSGPSIFLTKPR